MAGDDPGRAELEERLADANEAMTGLDQLENIGIEEGTSVSLSGIGIDWVGEKLLKKWRENPGLMLYKLQANSYKFSWLLIPISIPLVWLLFAARRRFKGYDHAIFVTYSLSFMTLLFVVISLLYRFGTASWLLGLAALFVPPVHIYKQLRGAYGLSRLSAIWRLLVLQIFIVVIVTVFLNLLLMLGAF